MMVEHNQSANVPSGVGYDNKYKFNGKELDDATQMYYYGARYYDPRISIFVSVDPLAEQFQGWTPYHYVHNNPINLIDPTGMEAERDYRLNRDGSFTQLNDATTPDRVFNESGESVELEHDGQIEAMKKYGGTSVMKFNNSSKSTEAFEFFSRNSEVEWGEVKTDQSSYVLTDHSTFSVNASGFAYSFLLSQGKNVTDINHSHPIHVIGAETPSDYGYNRTSDNSYSEPNPHREPDGDYKAMKDLIYGFSQNGNNYKGYGDKARKINYRVYNPVTNTYIKYDEQKAVKE